QVEGQASGGWPPRLSAGPEATVAGAFRAPGETAKREGKRHGRFLPGCGRMKKSSHPARRPSAGAMASRGGTCFAGRPHRPITELGFDPHLSTFMGVAMLVTVMAIRGIVIEDGAEALAVPDDCVDGPGQIDEEGLVGLDLRVALDRDGDGLAGLARRER